VPPDDGSYATPTQISRQAAARDLIELVGIATGWRLPPDRWTAVADALQEAETALAAGDPATVRAAAQRLEESGPGRVVRLGVPVPPPDQIRERLGRILHRTADPPTTPDAAQEKRDNRPAQ
jgi:hypothetical protein